MYSISSGNVECKSSCFSLSLSFEGRKIPLGYIKGGVLREDSISATAFSPPFCDRVQSVFSALVVVGAGKGEGECVAFSSEEPRGAEQPGTESSSRPERGILPSSSTQLQAWRKSKTYRSLAWPLVVP